MCLANVNHRLSKTSKLPIAKPCRPYSEYNLFFQLEREYILQVEFGLKPDYKEETFDSSDSSVYKGPPLPSRYEDVIYLNDWHLPGKEKRRKRRHRKSHGLIGFRELSLKIADAWRSVDSETRHFCAEVSDLGQKQYKVEMRAYLEAQDDKFKSGVGACYELHDTAIVSDGSVAAHPSSFGPSLLMLSDNSSTDCRFVTTNRWSLAEVDASFENDLALSYDKVYKTVPGSTACIGTAVSPVGSFVDLEDDEIIDLWTSTVVDNKSIDAFDVFQDVTFPPCNSSTCVTLDDLKNMRNILVDQQIQMKCTMAALAATYGFDNFAQCVTARSA